MHGWARVERFARCFVHFGPCTLHSGGAGFGSFRGTFRVGRWSGVLMVTLPAPFHQVAGGLQVNGQSCV